MEIKKFTFNPFQENTYILYDDTKEAVIVDPGCYDSSERNEIADFIDSQKLNLKRLLNTHAHIDHVFGNAFIARKYKLELELHPLDEVVLASAGRSANIYNLNYEESPKAVKELKEGDLIEFGKTELNVLHVPGHAPGHVVFLNEKEKVMIGGDVLFRGSIGRTDLPGGNHQQLISQIKSKIFTLPEDYLVYSGHGQETTIGYEKKNNPFF